MKEVESSTREYYSSSKERHYSHPVIQAFSAPKYQWIGKKIPLEGKSVLDVGSGNGYFAQHFIHDCDLTALDLSENQLQFNPATNKKIGSAYALPFADNTFDIVFASNLLHHLEQPAAALKEMRRVSRKYVVINEPNRNNPLIFMGAFATKRERGAIYSSRRLLSRIIGESGLSIHAHTFIGGFVMPNLTPACLLPLAMSGSLTPASFFQVFITEKTQ